MDRLKKMQKAIQGALDKPWLYDPEEYHTLKKQLFQIKTLRKKQQEELKSYVGFGYTQSKVSYDEMSALVEGNPEDVVESVDVEVVEDTHEV